tara:strand:+ start:419 stop:1153 length:735 start_codon:yes stop_codon:yes gene_type:complete
MISFCSEPKKVYSQQNQDGVLEKIFDTIGTTNKHFVELGSSGRKDGQGNSIYLREEYGFDGLLVDAAIPEETCYDLKHAFITSENINEILNKYDTPNKFDFLSIDIDGEDIYVMNAIDLDRFSPRVVGVEFNTALLPQYAIAQRHNLKWVWDGWHYYGCSIQAITKLMNSKSYSLVGISGCDAFFVLNEEIADIEIEDLNDWSALYWKYATKPAEDLQLLCENFLDSNFFINIHDGQTFNRSSV